jgi:serine/threonine protein kinase
MQPSVKEEEPRVMMLNPQGGRVPRRREPPISELGVETRSIVKRREEEGKERRRAALERQREASRWDQRLRGGHKLRKTFYIGLNSPEERKRLFLHYFGGSSQTTPQATPEEFSRGPLHRLETAVEDPYNPDSWPTRRQLRRMGENPLSTLDVATHFKARYTVVGGRQEEETSTRPSLYNIRELSDYFRHLLYGRDDLFLKVVPLYVHKSGQEPSGKYKEDWQLQEIYNEVVAGYFLNELVYGYSQVLSLHFMTIVDWFVAVKKDVIPGEEGKAQQLYHQVVVIDRMDQSLEDYLEENPSVEVLRAVLFQLFHALEIAWHTNRFIHGDLHIGNVMVQRIGANSPLYAKDFLYRRLSSPHWYRVDRDALHGNLLKMIDFGRSGLFIPSEPDHILPQKGGRHVHDREVRSEYAEYRENDVDSLFTDLRTLSAAWWKRMDAFQPAFDRLFRMDVINVLDDPFFDLYRTEAVLPNRTLTDEEVLSERDSHVVVSFLVDPLEAEMLETREMTLDASSSKRTLSQCSVCHASHRDMTHRVGENELLCGLSCYEFRYLFQGKTVFR